MQGVSCRVQDSYHSPSRQEQLVDFKTSNLPLAHCLRQCLSIYSTNLYEGVKIPDLQINRFARILRAGGAYRGTSLIRNSPPILEPS